MKDFDTEYLVYIYFLSKIIFSLSRKWGIEYLKALLILSSYFSSFLLAFFTTVDCLFTHRLFLQMNYFDIEYISFIYFFVKDNFFTFEKRYLEDLFVLFSYSSSFLLPLRTVCFLINTSYKWMIWDIDFLFYIIFPRQLFHSRENGILNELFLYWISLLNIFSKITFFKLARKWSFKYLKVLLILFNFFSSYFYYHCGLFDYS